MLLQKAGVRFPASTQVSEDQHLLLDSMGICNHMSTFSHTYHTRAFTQVKRNFKNTLKEETLGILTLSERLFPK